MHWLKLQTGMLQYPGGQSDNYGVVYLHNLMTVQQTVNPYEYNL